MSFSSLIFPFLLILHVQVSPGKAEKNGTLCTTPSCVKIAAHFLDCIDFTKDPCEDFFDFSCGKFLDEYPIPEDRTEYSVNTLVEQRVERQMKQLLENETKEKTKSKAVHMTRIIYKTCLNKTRLNDEKSKPMIQMIDDLGGWPILQKNYKESKTSVTDLLAKSIKKYGSSAFINLMISSDWKKPKNTMLQMDQGTLALGYGSRDYFLNATTFEKQMKAYKKLITDVVDLLAKDLNISPQYSDIDEMIKFETELAKITIPEEERRNYTKQYNKRALEDLSSANMTPFIEWGSFFNQMLPKDVEDFVKKPTFRINVNEPTYMSELNALFTNTPKKTIFNYIIWRAVQGYITVLDERYENVNQDFEREFLGRQQKTARWKQCFETTKASMQISSGAMYVRKYFGKDAKTETANMIKYLVNAFKSMINKLDWMDNETKKLALQKADKMGGNVGYPDLALDDKLLDEFYNKLDFDESNSYFEIAKRIAVWFQEKAFADLLKPFDREKWEMSPAEVNAYYSPEKNSFTFPAAILSFPYFQFDLPKYINYGATGATIGHELTHGFDDQGSQYDENGGLNNWWSKSSFDKFDTKGHCMIKQYDQYRVKGVEPHVNGINTLGENIADNGGLKEAYIAYLNFVKENGPEGILPGLEQFSNEQLFYISYANSWCGKRQKEDTLRQVLTDPHSPAQFRVNGVVVNSDEFADVFKCKSGTAMNPDRNKQPKCPVW